ncbi:MAG: ADP-ribosylglycohydrolase family protein [Clostridiales bacterium]|nr:ADP-ribosylglycohydrolase family protein [Clostridiales bacterium]
MENIQYIKELLSLELTERKEEGCKTDDIAEKLLLCGDNAEKLNELYRELIELPVSADFPFYEPDSLDEILAASKGKFYATDAEIPESRFLGAWLGRCVGCALGKPLEKEPFTCGTDGIPGWKYIYEWFRGAGAYPIKDYVPAHSQAEEKYNITAESGSAPSLRENISFMQTDDDIRYMILALILLETKGKSFTVGDVKNIWHTYLPVNMTFTAERQAYINACIADVMFADTPEKYDYIRRHENPYREWIGAQIRVDVYAYASAGDVREAARLAYTDASFSHTKNGVYGAMFCAAMIAAAFTENNVKRTVEAGLSVIPSDCRLYHAVKKACEIAEAAETELELVEKINNEFGQYSSVHTINNACLCAAAVIYGKGDFEKSVTTAVLGGWDTDCNGATVGSVLGAMNSAEGIPQKWTEPLHDTLYSSIPGFHPISISECAKRTYRLWQK